MSDREVPRGLIARTVREALDAVVSPDVGQRVLSAALLRSHLTEVPEDPDRFKEFLAPFRAIALESLGDEATSLLFEELDHLAARAITSRLPPRWGSSPPRSRNRISSPPTRPPSQAPAGYRHAGGQGKAAPHFRLTPQKIHAICPPTASSSSPREADLSTPPDSSELPRGMARALGVMGSEPKLGKPTSRAILLCSSDSALEQRIGAWVVGRARLVLCQSLIELVKLVESGTEKRIVVFVDCRRPTLRPMSLAALSEDLPAHVEVVLWGATPGLVNDLTQLFAGARQWMVCAPTLGAEEAIQRCVELMS